MGDERTLLHRICCRQSGDKIFRIWFPCCVYIFPCCKVWRSELNRRYANGEAANRHLLIPVSSLRLSRAAGGIISVDYYTVSDVVIKPNQETQTRETNREQKNQGRKDCRKKQQSDAERKNKERTWMCVCGCALPVLWGHKSV